LYYCLVHHSLNALPKLRQFNRKLLISTCIVRIRLKIEIEIGLKFNQSEKSISSLMNFALIS